LKISRKFQDQDIEISRPRLLYYKTKTMKIK